MIEERTGRTPLGADVERVMKLTLGNPLFVELLLRCRGLPDGDEIRNPLLLVIAAAAEEHLLALSESTREILAVASVLGRNFEVPVLRALADCAPAVLLDGLTEAELLAVLAGLRRHHPAARLLGVLPAGADRPPGTVRVTPEGLICGYIERFAPPGAAQDFVLETWLALCVNAARLADGG